MAREKRKAQEANLDPNIYEIDYVDRPLAKSSRIGTIAEKVRIVKMSPAEKNVYDVKKREI
jgi:hypothetical protein